MNKLSCSKSIPKKKLLIVRPGMKKTAQDTATSFNETVPSTDTGMPLAADQGQPVPQKNTIVNEASDPYAVVPQGYGGEEQGTQEQMDFSAPPEMIGAAHSFLGPEVMQSAMGGDPNAQDLIARTAAQIGSTFMNMSANAANIASAGGMPQEMGQSGMEGGIPGQEEVPQGITSPEDDLAAELVPNIGLAPAGIPGQEQQQGAPGQGEQGTMPQMPAEGEMVDANTVARLIQLARAGKI